MRLTEHFTLGEFEASQTATRKGIDNSVPSRLVPRLRALCRNVLEPIRVHLGKPVIVTSGYRCLLLNQLIGGADHSSHIDAEAADIMVPGLSTHDLFETIISLDLPYDQIIDEFGRWVHISHRANRDEELLARTIDGRTLYTYA